MDLPAGTVLGDTYRISRLIGIGGMGAIYEAAHVGAGKRVAIKMMSRELAAHPEALARFRREVKVTTELAHPHIIDVVDFGASPTGEPYLVMEYLDGEDLEQRAGARRPDAAARWRCRSSSRSRRRSRWRTPRASFTAISSRATCSCCSVEGGGVFVKVVDFGISKVLKATTTKLTMARAVVGTPEFMAPEQAAGRVDQVDHRSDQWALACLAWHMLSGRLPFWKPDVHAILNQVITGEPTPLAPEFARTIPREVDKVLRRALSKSARIASRRSPPSRARSRRRRPACRCAGRAGGGADGSRRTRPSRRSNGLWLMLGVAALAIAAAAGWMFRDEIMSSPWWPDDFPRAQGAKSSTGAPVAPDDAERRHRRPPRH